MTDLTADTITDEQIANALADTSTFVAVVRDSNDHRRVLAKSSEWNTEQDADVLGRLEIESAGWHRVDRAVICVEEKRYGRKAL